MSAAPPVVRFSLATLLLVFAWVALLCIGLTAPSPKWSGLITAVSIFAVMTAILAVIYQSGHARAFAMGFAIFGCCYLLWLHRIEGYAPGSFSRTLARESFIVLNKGEWDSLVTGRLRPPDASSALVSRRDRFVETMQSAMIMFVATLGGFIGRYLSIKRANESG